MSERPAPFVSLRTAGRFSRRCGNLPQGGLFFAIKASLHLRILLFFFAVVLVTSRQTPYSYFGEAVQKTRETLYNRDNLFLQVEYGGGK